MTDTEAKVRAALRHPELAWIMQHVPARYRDNLPVVRSIMAAAARGDPSLINAEPYRAAYGALDEAQQVRGLRDRIGELYHDPRVQRAAGDKLDWYLAHPAAAYDALLRDPKLAAELGPELRQQAMVAALEARDFGVADAPVASAPIPTDAAKFGDEYSALIKKSVTPGQRLTAAEQERLNALAGTKAERESAADEATAAAVISPAAKPDAYRVLIRKSITPGGLTAGETSRLNEMATARAEAAGLIEQPEPQESGNE